MISGLSVVVLLATTTALATSTPAIAITTTTTTPAASTPTPEASISASSSSSISNLSPRASIAAQRADSASPVLITDPNNANLNQPPSNSNEPAQLLAQRQVAALRFGLSQPAGSSANQRADSGDPQAEAAPAERGSGEPVNGDRDAVYTNQFVIEVKGGELEARKVAQKHGFVYLNHILGDYYHLEHRRLSKRSTNNQASELNITIQDEPQVLLLERQVLKRRVKRDFLELNLATAKAGPHLLVRPPNQRPASPHQPHPNPQPSPQLSPHSQQHHYARPANQAPAEEARGAFPQRQQLAPLRLGPKPAVGEGAGRALDLLESAASNLLYQQHANLAPPLTNPKQAKLSPSSFVSSQANSTTLNRSQTDLMMYANQTSASTSTTKRAPFNDPSWPLMWYLDGGAKNGFDLNVMAAWKMGYTGKGIVITILDDGLEKDHPDLQANYDPLASFDINGDDADPMPRYDSNDSNRHGTRCAGEVAAVPDNNICSIGIAYNSKVGGVRMLDGDVTDAVEARSLGLNNQHIHIYSASWGPDDNGKTVDGPGEMATRAFIEGVTNGRQGLGSIFVFASGNGGREHDNCNCDGYTNSIWTLSISSATENGFVPWYIEACSSTLATTYSSGSYDERQIATTDLHHSCTSSHTGTSASAPLAAGICALVLESNPKLTWRDMQHIVVRTAKPANLVAKDWRSNALGRNVSHAFGYGLMDAAAMITMAKRWITVPVQFTCEVRSPQMDKFIPAKGYIELKLRAECSNVRFLEHVQSKVTLTSSRRGDLHIYLVSPHGTRSTLLAQRPNDQAEQGFRNWPFMTVHSWGESPNGVWTLEVHNDGKPLNRAYLKEWTLILYGTNDDPNRHLDSQAASASAPHIQSPPAATPPTAPFKPVASAPPAPLPTLQQHPSYPNVELEPANPHWSYASPPPPPPISGAKPSSTPPPPPQTSTQSSTSSYLTTFKTMLSGSGGQKQPIATTTTMNPLHHAQMHGSSKIPPQQVASTEPAKADFETVTPPSASQPADSARKPALSSFGFGSNVVVTEPTNSMVHQNNNSQLGNSNIVKPTLTQLDTNSDAKLEPPMKPPIEAQDPSTQQPPNNELDGNNQIDLKLSKDYRSSGDQSIYDKSLLADLSSSPSDIGKTAQSKPHQKSSASSFQANSVLLLITTLQLINHLTTNPLVRFQIRFRLALS